MEVILARSIEAFGRDEWNQLFPDELEDWSYLRAVENSCLAGFEWFYLAAWDGARLRAAVPGFLTNYRLDTTLSGSWKRVTSAISRALPGLFSIPLVSLGSPVGETCRVGFAADCGAAERRRLLGLLMTKLEEFARQRRVGMIAIKDAREGDDALWSDACERAGLRRMPGQATAVLELPYRRFEEYLAALGPGTRRDMRRKLRARAALRIEWRDDVEDIIDRVMTLYRATLAGAEYTFEELTPDYFRGVLRDARAACVTYWLDARLIGFNLVLRDGARLLDKFFGMELDAGRAHNLYYVSWMENVRYCIEHGIHRYQSGQGLEREKVRLGSRLDPNWLWYRHRNRIVDRAFAAIERFFALDAPQRAPAAPERSVGA